MPISLSVSLGLIDRWKCSEMLLPLANTSNRSRPLYLSRDSRSSSDTSRRASEGSPAIPEPSDRAAHTDGGAVVGETVEIYRPDNNCSYYQHIPDFLSGDRRISGTCQNICLK